MDVGASPGPVAVVTGAGGGLGRAIARRLADDGYAVAVVDIDHDKAQETVVSINGAGGRVRGGRVKAWAADLRDAAAIDLLIDEVEGTLGPVTALVNNAAVFPAGPITDMTPEGYDDTIAVNQRAYFLMARAAVHRMQAGGRAGGIVNLGSITQHGGWGEMVAYATTKGAAATMTRALATEVGPDEIRVNCVAPGAFPTRAEEMHDDPEAYSRRIIESQALKRRGRLEDVAAAVSFLLGPDASFITGQTLNVDGGWKMA